MYGFVALSEVDIVALQGMGTCAEEWYGRQIIEFRGIHSIARHFQ